MHLSKNVYSNDDFNYYNIKTIENNELFRTSKLKCKIMKRQILQTEKDWDCDIIEASLLVSIECDKVVIGSAN